MPFKLHSFLLQFTLMSISFICPYTLYCNSDQNKLILICDISLCVFFKYEQDRQRKCNVCIQACSCDNCCSVKAKIIAHFECLCSLSYPACNSYVKYRLRPPGSTILFHIISQTARFSKNLLNAICLC